MSSSGKPLNSLGGASAAAASPASVVGLSNADILVLRRFSDEVTAQMADRLSKEWVAEKAALLKTVSDQQDQIRVLKGKVEEQARMITTLHFLLSANQQQPVATAAAVGGDPRIFSPPVIVATPAAAALPSLQLNSFSSSGGRK